VGSWLWRRREDDLPGLVAAVVDGNHLGRSGRRGARRRLSLRRQGSSFPRQHLVPSDPSFSVNLNSYRIVRKWPGPVKICSRSRAFLLRYSFVFYGRFCDLTKIVVRLGHHFKH
jgi:hypothetical protein